jgi:hypothetical protein
VHPLSYRDHLLDVLKNSPDVQRVLVPEGTPYPYPLEVTVAGRDHLWQVIGQGADGAQKGAPTAPVAGAPPAWTDAPADGAADAWLAGVIGRAEPADVERLKVWSANPAKKSEGVTVFFHNGERAFLRRA